MAHKAGKVLGESATWALVRRGEEGGERQWLRDWEEWEEEEEEEEEEGRVEILLRLEGREDLRGTCWRREG